MFAQRHFPSLVLTPTSEVKSWERFGRNVQVQDMQKWKIRGAINTNVGQGQCCELNYVPQKGMLIRPHKEGKTSEGAETQVAVFRK